MFSSWLMAFFFPFPIIYIRFLIMQEMFCVIILGGWKIWFGVFFVAIFQRQLEKVFDLKFVSVCSQPEEER